jgi:hypothetical protein
MNSLMERREQHVNVRYTLPCSGDSQTLAQRSGRTDEMVESISIFIFEAAHAES